MTVILAYGSTKVFWYFRSKGGVEGMSVSEWGMRDRCVILGKYLIESGGTVRSAAAQFGVSKSTVHKDVTQNLRRIDRGLYLEVREVLQKNKEERHLRGGEATKQKYSSQKKHKTMSN